MIFVLAILIAAFAFTAGYFCRRHDYEAGYIAGQCEERSVRNAIVIQAKYSARNEGIVYGCEHHAALMSRRFGNVSATPVSNATANQL